MHEMDEEADEGGEEHPAINLVYDLTNLLYLFEG
jgi:hypothetical protein